MSEKWKNIIDVAQEAGRIILQYYSQQDENAKTTEKENGSPLTIADIEAHKYIARRLKEETPDIPIISEEGREIPYSQRRQWNKFWLVDPLDGTKEFISRNGEFTVNIALIENNEPVFGVIYVPVQGITYYGDKEEGSYKIDASGRIFPLKREGVKTNSNSIRIVGSRSHSNERFTNFIKELEKTYDNVILKSVGSSLKFCILAENQADQYPRFTPTMEWDTSAGHAIAKFSGYQVLSLADEKELSYNKESLLNDEFIVL